MGCNIFAKHGQSDRLTTAPNPDPSRWTLLEKAEYTNGYVLKVKYHNCTNFEGVKVMVYEGTYKPTTKLDPHFSFDCNAPIARFRPDAEGWERANQLAKTL